ncbi:Protein of unknown function [Leifsonia sp. 98AMF]|uniref:DUF3892 domain-containing protein n=1 Tax=unclassified Leifsonia TaxID=2663824 RepID=UPI0008799481|nr:Protein of unknown function [Leifsonia sp. 197AMF]SDJ05228.1 Protein of unknown function [Leifsonia sp. 466MF]SDN25647.1 Protein of unknown function [Leifsonia sp. 509MF]SFM27593.1 Protein of unknown function [Leifsonia sp. 98AMF]
MYQITAIKVSSRPPQLGTITDYFFEGRNGEMNKWFTKSSAVDYVNRHPSTVYVAGGGTTAYVEVVSGSPDYLRTHGDGTLSDNLLSLPIY